MRPFFPENRLREIRLSRNVVEKLNAKELMRLYAMFGVVIFTEYYAFSDVQRIFAGHPDFDQLKPGEPLPRYFVEMRQVKRHGRPFKLFKMTRREPHA